MRNKADEEGRNVAASPPEKCYTETAVQKQYELAVGVHQGESGRFWTRFNIFIGIQFAGGLGVISNLPVLTLNPGIFRFVMVFCLLISSLFVVVCIRGIMSSHLLLRLIERLEGQSSELINIIAMTRELDRLPQYVNFIVAAVIASMFTAAWCIALVQLEISAYSINIPE